MSKMSKSSSRESVSPSRTSNYNSPLIFKNIPTWIIHVEKSLRAALQDVEVKMMNCNDRLRNELVENTIESVAKLEKKVEEKAEASKKIILDQVEDGFSQVQKQN